MKNQNMKNSKENLKKERKLWYWIYFSHVRMCIYK